MSIRKRWIWVLVGLVGIFATVSSAALIFAQEPDDNDAAGTVGGGPAQERSPRPWFKVLRAWHRQAHSRPRPLVQFLNNAVNQDQLLADALDVSLDELRQARKELQNAAILEAVAQAVAAGAITQDEADEILAVKGLSDSISREDLAAEALGIDADQLQEAHRAHKQLPELLNEQGLTPLEFRENLQNAFQEAVEEAAAAGAITQDQADLILKNTGPFMSRFFDGTARDHPNRD
jgi:hypothetical protein